MNILYVGPYRHNNDYGIQSRLYLENIINTPHNVTCRPIYFGMDNIDKQLLELSTFERTILKSYDILIQHCPLDWAQTHGGFNKNIIIPIIGNIGNLRNHQKKNIAKFDTVVVDNNNHESLFVRSGYAENIRRVSCPIIKTLCENLKEKRINLGINNTSKKFYFFGNIQRDMELIQKLLVSFYVAFRAEFGKSIIMYLDEAPPQDQKNFFDIVKGIKQKLRIAHSNHATSEMFIFKNLSFQEKIIAHNTCDILLSFGTEFRSTIQEQHAKYFNNSIINIENVDVIEVPNLNHTTNYYPEDTEHSIVTQSLINEMVECSKKNPKSENHNTETFNTLASLI